jgi:hypothetical protein
MSQRPGLPASEAALSGKNGQGKYQMIIKTDTFELEISCGTGVYFGSKTSGQLFRKWEEFRDKEKQQIELIQNSVKKLLLESESIFLDESNNYIKENLYAKNNT